MRKTACFVLALGLLFVAAAAVPPGAAEKCDALKKAMDDAWARNLAADAAWDKFIDALLLAMELEEATENAYVAAVKAVRQADKDWKAAVKSERACLARNPEPKCKRLIQAARDAAQHLAEMEAREARFELGMGETALATDMARRAMSNAQKAAQAARDAYEKAREAYMDCLLGRKTFR